MITQKDLIEAGARHSWGALHAHLMDRNGKVLVSLGDESVGAFLLSLANSERGLARRCMRRRIRAAHRQARWGF